MDKITAGTLFKIYEKNSCKQVTVHELNLQTHLIYNLIEHFIRSYKLGS